MTRARPTGTDSRLAAHCAAIASAGAGVLHLVVTPSHWRDWAPSGWFFLGLALIQLGWAALAWSKTAAWLMAVGIAVNGGAAVLWVTSCVAGPPVGPSAGHPETVGAAGICVLLLECYAVMGAAWSWLRHREAREIAVPARAAVLVGANTVMAGAVLLGLVGGLHGQHQHHGPHDTAADRGADHGADHGAGRGPVPPAPEQALPLTDMGAPVDAPAAPQPGGAAGADGHDHHHDAEPGYYQTPE